MGPAHSLLPHSCPFGGTGQPLALGNLRVQAAFLEALSSPFPKCTHRSKAEPQGRQLRSQSPLPRDKNKVCNCQKHYETVKGI